MRRSWRRRFARPRRPRRKTAFQARIGSSTVGTCDYLCRPCRKCRSGRCRSRGPHTRGRMWWNLRYKRRRRPCKPVRPRTRGHTRRSAEHSKRYRHTRPRTPSCRQSIPGLSLCKRRDRRLGRLCRIPRSSRSSGGWPARPRRRWHTAPDHSGSPSLGCPHCHYCRYCSNTRRSAPAEAPTAPPTTAAPVAFRSWSSPEQ